ncbi:hypothetical protein CHS0354_002692 [Potamilus streckersoni]|uniref:tRNA N(3)-methylcytidine methyltransferase n=1 Tax=Potamilus streckersoni TaxID=2493646 RepID=A0AAE0VKW3_9BIVA|nr:hypothetical protein CHS0354_002692 [Potamilus streckersoni]
MANSSKEDFEPDFIVTNCACSSTCKPRVSNYNSYHSEPVSASNDNEDCESWDFQDIPKHLTDEEKVKLEKDNTLVTEFKQRKLELEAEKNWDLFYKRNTTKFFKDRHWTKREFIDLVRENKQFNGTVFEVGCGVGNFMFPLMEEDPSLNFIACDFSKRAVQFVKEHPQYDAERCTVFHCDATKDNLASHILPNSVDMATMIFVLSAIHPDKMVDVLKNVFQVLKPGGHLLFRDYGLYDYAMLRFAPGHKLEENFYVRQDGTRAYYFSKEKLESLVTAAGYDVKELQYVHRETVNKKEGLCVPRIFVQGKFTKHSVQDQVEHK